MDFLLFETVIYTTKIDYSELPTGSDSASPIFSPNRCPYERVARTGASMADQGEAAAPGPGPPASPSQQVETGGAGDGPRTLWVGELQYWMDETYLESAFSASGADVVKTKVCVFDTSREGGDARLSREDPNTRNR